MDVVGSVTFCATEVPGVVPEPRLISDGRETSSPVPRPRPDEMEFCELGRSTVRVRGRVPNNSGGSDSTL